MAGWHLPLGCKKLLVGIRYEFCQFIFQEVRHGGDSIFFGWPHRIRFSELTSLILFISGCLVTEEAGMRMKCSNQIKFFCFCHIDTIKPSGQVLWCTIWNGSSLSTSLYIFCDDGVTRWKYSP